jgi:hypothetical protein
MGAAPGVEAGTNENTRLSLDMEDTDSSFGGSLLKRGEEALDRSPKISPKRHSKRFKKLNSHPGTPYAHNKKSRKSFSRESPRRKSSTCNPIGEERHISPPASPSVSRVRKSSFKSSSQSGKLSPSVRRASISSALRKSFRDSSDGDDEETRQQSPPKLADEFGIEDSGSSSDEEIKKPPKQPSHLRTPASMKKGFFKGRGSLEDFSKQLQLFKVQSRTFHDNRINEARSSYKRAEMKTRRMSKKIADAVQTFKANTPKHSEDGDSKSKWQHYAKKINHKEAVKRTRNRLKSMNSFWYVLFFIFLLCDSFEL